MKVILLCAGYATRLYPLTKDKPKPLLEVGYKPIIDYLTDGIMEVEGVDGIFVVTNDKFYGGFSEWAEGKGVEVVNDGTTANDNRLGAIGDILFVIEKYSVSDDILIIAGDNIFDLSLRDFISYAESKSPAGVIAAYDVKDIELAKKYGLLVVDIENRVIEFQEKPENPKTTLASLGLYFYPKHIIDMMKKYVDEGNNPDQPGNFVAWLYKREDVFAYVFDTAWFDIGDFKSLEEADRYYKNKNNN